MDKWLFRVCTDCSFCTRCWFWKSTFQARCSPRPSQSLLLPQQPNEEQPNKEQRWARADRGGSSSRPSWQCPLLSQSCCEGTECCPSHKVTLYVTCTKLYTGVTQPGPPSSWYQGIASPHPNQGHVSSDLPAPLCAHPAPESSSADAAHPTVSTSLQPNPTAAECMVS